MPISRLGIVVSVLRMTVGEVTLERSELHKLKEFYG